MPVPSPNSAQAPQPVKPAKPAAAKEADKAEPGGNLDFQRDPVGPAHKPPQTDEDKKKKNSWIEIEMVGEDGKPYPGESFRLRFPDGSITGGTLDEKGFARVQGIEPGSVEITFPNLDKEAWDPA